MSAYVRTESGLIVPQSFAEGDSSPVMREVATTRDGRDITRGLLDPMVLLRPSDSVLQARGHGNYRIYREVLRDDQVKTAFQQRQLAVTSREWQVNPGGDRPIDEAAAEHLREQLARIEWDDITAKMLYGVFYGYAAAEVMWGREGGRVVIDEIRVRDRERFAFDGAMRLRLRTTANPVPGEEVPARKFWHFATGADHDDEPYGIGLAHWLYWPVYFKRGGTKLWLTFLDKFGAPTVKGTYPPNATDGEKSRLLAATEAVASESGVILPEGMAVELMEASRSGSASYSDLFDRMNSAIAKVVLGQVGTIEGTPGRLGSEDTQQDVRDDLVKADADLVCQSFNTTVARWLTEYNFPGAAVPAVWRIMDDPEDLNRRADRDKVLADIGYRPTLATVQDTYGEGYEPAGDSAGGAAGPAFAEPRDAERWHNQDVALIDDEADRLAADWERHIGRRVEDMVALAEETEDLATFRERLAELAAEPPPPEARQAFERAFFAARLWGRWRADTDAQRMDADDDNGGSPDA